MPSPFTKDETTLIMSAIDREIDSAKRQQNMKGKTQTMKEVFAAHERTLNAIKAKVADLK